MTSVSFPPKQKRSAETLEKIMVAGLKVLASEGWDGCTIAAVAKRAGVGGASIYDRFEDHNAMMMALLARFSRNQTDDWLPKFKKIVRENLELGELIHALIAETAASYQRHQDLMRAFVARGIQDPRVADAGDREIRAGALEFEEALLARRDQFGCPDPELAVAVCFQLVIDACLRLVLFGPDSHSPHELTWDSLVDEMSTMCLKYLRD